MLANMNSEVAVIIPTFNGASKGFLFEALESVLAQTIPPSEIVIINDGSTDDTAKLVKNRYPAIKLISSENSGLAASRNRGARETTQKFLCFLDDDDVWYPQKLEIQLNLMNSDDQIDIICCSVHMINKQGHIFDVFEHDVSQLVFPQILMGNPLRGPSGVMIRRELFNKVGGFNESLKMVEDYDFWIRTSQISNINSVQIPLLKYRVHPHQMTHKIDQIEKCTIQVIKSHTDRKNNTLHNRLVGFYIAGCFYRSIFRLRWRHLLFVSSELLYNNLFFLDIMLARLVGAILFKCPKIKKIWRSFERYIVFR